MNGGDPVPVPKPRTKFVSSPNAAEEASTRVSTDDFANKPLQNGFTPSLYPFKEAGIQLELSEPSTSSVETSNVFSPYVNVSSFNCNGNAAEESANTLLASPNNNSQFSKVDSLSPPNREAPLPPPVPKVTANPPIFHAPPPPPRPPPPAGWNLQKQTTPHRQAPAPPLPSSMPTGSASPLVFQLADHSTITPPAIPKRTTSNHSYVNINKNASALDSVVQKPQVHRYESLVPEFDSSPSSLTPSPPAIVENRLYMETGGRLVPCPSTSASLLLLPSKPTSAAPSSQFIDQLNSCLSKTPIAPPDSSMADYRTGAFSMGSALSDTPQNYSEKRSTVMSLNGNTVVPSPTRVASIASNTYTPMPSKGDFRDSALHSQISVSSLVDPFEASKLIDFAKGDFKMVDSDSDENVCSDEETSAHEEGVIDGTAVCFVSYVQMHLGKKDRKRMLARIKNSSISFLEDEETEECISGPYTISTCSFIGLSPVDDSIEIRLADGEPQKRITFTPEENANHWMMLLGECWLTRTQNLKCCIQDLDNINMFGEVWLKLGTASPWIRAAVALCKHMLRYDMLEEAKYDAYELDLKKALNIREKVDKNEWCTKCKKNSRGPFSLTLDGCTLYMECADEWTTTKWFETISKILTEPASKLEDFRRTKENVPFIVDKCISFVESYGLRSEGVYRRNGKIVEAREIRAKLLQDPTETFLMKKDDETVYAVADVLRQFFRLLESPLIARDIQTDILNIASGDPSEALYKQLFVLLKRLPPVHYSTLKKLIGHLKTVTDHNLENKQTIGNVAKVFGPTIFHTDNEDASDYKLNSLEISVVVHLITGYRQTFEVSMHEEVGREMIEEKEKLKAPLILANATRADGMLVPIHVWQHENRPFNVKSDRAAEEVCQEAMSSRGVETKPVEKYALYEVIRNCALKRRLPPAEKLSVTVLDKWLSWGITDGYFLFDRDQVPFSEDDMSTFSGKVKFAEAGSKSFKSCEARIEEGVKITLSKGDKCLKTLPLDESVCYYGSSCKKPPYAYNLTFISISSIAVKSKSASSLSGLVLSFPTSADRRRFSNAVQYVQTGGSQTPLVHI